MKLLDAVAGELKTAKILSVDIFDTLLLRMTRRPSAVFEKTYAQSPQLFPAHIDAADWREIRASTETFTQREHRNRGIGDISLDDIYSRLPGIIGNREEIKQLEIACEKQLCFVNDEIVDVISAALGYGIKVILTSDMYLRKDDLKSILAHNGFDISRLSNIYVSSEARATKRSGKLFDMILNNEQIAAGDMLHIGDNLIADYRMPKKKGIRAFLYAKISNACMTYPFLRIEEAIYGGICNELYALRILAASRLSHGEKHKDWYDVGAMQFGPLLTLAVEWVLDLAEQQGVSQIFPLMREGKFLTAMLRIAQQERGRTGKIEPMYISRKALYPALLSVIADKDIRYNYLTKQLTVGNLLNLLELPALLEEYAEHSGRTITETKYIYNGARSLYSELWQILTDSNLLSSIRERSQEKDGLFYQYLEQLGLTGGDYITFDIGWRGNAQNAIQRVMNKNGAKTRGLHLLVNAKKYIAKGGNLDDNCDIRGYTGNFGKNENAIADIIVFACELFLMCDEGTTVGYVEKNGRIVPQVKEMRYPEEQLEQIYAAQQGILAFQREYFKLSKKKKLCSSEKEAANIAGRLLRYPTAKEAAMIGGFSYDQNFGIDTQWNLISDEKLKQYSELGYEEFVYQKKDRPDEWYEGMEALLSPFAIYEKVFSKYVNNADYRMLGYVKHILKCVPGKFVLVCAAHNCKVILEFLTSANALDRVEFIIDNDSSLWNTRMNGIRIMPMGSDTGVADFVITQLTQKTIDDLRVMLYKVYGPDIKIYDRSIKRHTMWEGEQL